jgi:addiction module HigA family antidote
MFIQMKNIDSHHPGRLVRSVCLDAFGLSVTDAAKRLGVTRQALNNVVNERAAISPEMALRLDKAFGGGAENWLFRQVAFDLRQARMKCGELRVDPIDRRVPQIALPWAV